MTIKEAENIRDEFAENTNPSESDVFIFTEAMDYLISEKNRPSDMMFLGGVYYDMQHFDLALKYYEMAAALEYTPAYECLGYIWYYGRTGDRDYKKAFECFSKAAGRGDMVAQYKLADMYKNGYYVAKDLKKYEEIIEKAYRELEAYREREIRISVEAPIPEINTRLARIKKDRGEIDEAIELYLDAKRFLGARIKYNSFFGNLNIMMWLIDDLYSMMEFDNENFDFYDLYYLLTKPNKIKFLYNDNEYMVESELDGNECVIKFNNRWYHDRKEFFSKATIEDEKLTSIYDELYGFKLV